MDSSFKGEINAFAVSEWGWEEVGSGGGGVGSLFEAFIGDISIYVD